MRKTALVLQGGAALGAYEVGVVQRLYQEPEFQPDVIAGVSMGAITGAILAASRGDPQQRLSDFWRQLSTCFVPDLPAPWNRIASLLGISGFFRPRSDLWNAPFWSSFYDMMPLKLVLERLIDFDRIGKSGPRLLVAATNVELGCVEMFDSATDRITADHLLASGALPPAFPPVRIGPYHYWDGGLVDNRPLGAVVEAFGDDPAVEKRIVAVELAQGIGWIPENLLEVHDRIFELVFLDRFGFDHRQIEKRNDLAQLFSSLSEELPEDSAIRSLPGYRYLAAQKSIAVEFVRNRDEAILRGPFDFSASAISRRLKAGFADAESHLRGAANTLVEQVC